MQIMTITSATSFSHRLFVILSKLMSGKWGCSSLSGIFWCVNTIDMEFKINPRVNKPNAMTNFLLSLGNLLIFEKVFEGMYSGWSWIPVSGTWPSFSFVCSLHLFFQKKIIVLYFTNWELFTKSIKTCYKLNEYNLQVHKFDSRFYPFARIPIRTRPRVEVRVLGHKLTE